MFKYVNLLFTEGQTPSQMAYRKHSLIKTSLEITMPYQTDCAQQKNAYTNYNYNEAKTHYEKCNFTSNNLGGEITDECYDCWLPFS